MTNYKRKFLSILLTFTLIMTLMPTQAFAQNTTEPALNMNSVTTNLTTSSGIASNPYVGNRFEVEFNVLNQWEGAFTGEIRITNTGTEPIENWSLSFDFIQNITSIWNAEITSYQGNNYIIKNVGWNQDIAVGESITIGFNGEWSKEISPPTNYKVLGMKERVQATSYTANFNVLNNWEDAFTGQIIIKNMGEATVEDWILEFDFDRNIQQFWEADILEHEGTHYIIKNKGYNANIGVGETLKLGFMANPGTGDIEVSNYELTQIKAINNEKSIIEFDTSCLEKSDESYYVFKKISQIKGTITDISNVKSMKYKITSGNFLVKQGEIECNSLWSIPDIQLFIGENEIVVEAIDENDEIIQSSLVVTNYSDENMDYTALDSKDDDYDGLMNFQEEYFGTNKESKDTDQDGLSDLLEIISTKTNPIKSDTDDNGIKDGEEDFDQDGLNNFKEIEYNSDPFNSDTDDDNLLDNEEVQYGTLAYVYDTDEDGLSDGEEIIIGTNPLLPDTDGDGILDGDDLITNDYSVTEGEIDPNAVPSINITLAPDQVDSLEIKKLPDNNWYLPKELPGYIGSGYEFSVDGEFDTATLTFKFNSDYLTRDNFNPAIYYCDTEKQEMVLLDNQTIDLNKCTVSAPITHFSKYIVLDKTAFDRVWEEEIKATKHDEVNKALDIVLAIDSSGSMDWNDGSNIRIKVVKEFIECLRDNEDRASIIDFDDRTKILTQLTSNKDIIKSAVDKIDSSGGTSLTTGINTSLIQFNMNDDTVKFIIMLTDGDGDYDISLTKKAKQQGIKIYTIGLGSNVSTSVLSQMAKETGGQYYHASSANDLINEFKKLTQDVIELTKDTDGDGVTDYHETHLRLYNGVSIDTDPLKPDTDGDGLLDGEEVILRYNYAKSDTIETEEGSKQQYIVSVKDAYCVSDPTKVDTDDDDATDYLEVKYVEYEQPKFLSTRTVTVTNKDSDNDYLEDNDEKAGILTSIGIVKTDPRDPDYDKDGLLDGYEIRGKNMGSYYRVKSNPMLVDSDHDGKNDKIDEDPMSYSYGRISVGSDSCGYASGSVFASIVGEEQLVRTGYLENGHTYNIYKIIGMDGQEKDRKVLIEEGKDIRRFWLQAGKVGTRVRGAHNDEFYISATATIYGIGTIYSYNDYIDMGVIAAANTYTDKDLSFLDKDSVLYYDSSKGRVLTNQEWKEIIHIQERYILNDFTDAYLPINPVEAENQGFRLLSDKEAAYHNPTVNCKYIHEDGREAIYDKATGKKVTLAHQPEYGPTFNFSPNDNSKTSPKSIGHFYLDMLTYYWWQS